MGDTGISEIRHVHVASYQMFLAYCYEILSK